MANTFKWTKRRIDDDLGLGVKASPQRNVNKDGSFNVHRVGVPRLRAYELYHHLITMGGVKFLSLVLAGYLITNALFAGVYMAIGMNHFTRSGGDSFQDHLLDAFFFSAQTLTTVGYGHISPKSPMAGAVAAVESLVGLLCFALATGLLYGRFSRPQAKIRFSHSSLIAPYQDGSAFMFRLVNRRSNELIEVEATVSLSFRDDKAAGRRFVNLSLERDKIHLFPSNWTVVHPIDDASPLFGLTEADLAKIDAEFIILIKAFDDTFSQTVYARTSYRADEVIWGAKFVAMTRFMDDGITRMDLDLLDTTEPVELPPIAGMDTPSELEA